MPDTETTYCGIVLKGTTDEPCGVAFLTCAVDEDTCSVKTVSTTDDESIMDALEEHRPKIVALNAPQQRPDTAEFPDETDEDSALDPETASMYRSDEQDLVDDGHSVLPQKMRDQNMLERAEFLSNTIKRSGIGSQIIESHPELIADILDVDGDQALEQYGIDTEGIEHVREYNAVLLALTAKQHDEQEDPDTDRNIILPETDSD